MAHEILAIASDLVTLRISGIMCLADQQALHEVAKDIFARGAKLRVLALIEDFQGWSEEDGWNDIGFLAEHGDDVAKIAIVGDPRWKNDAYAFSGKGFRSTEIEFFEPSARADAVRWIAN